VPRRGCSEGWAQTTEVSVIPTPPSEPQRLTILPAKEAIRRARPLPSSEEMTIEGLTDEEWEAFEAAIAER